MTPSETELIPSEAFDGMFWSYSRQAYVPVVASHPEVQFAIGVIEAEATAYFAEVGDEWLAHEASDLPHYTFPFVAVGGHFDSATHVADGWFAPPPPDDTGPTAFDWLLAA